MWLNFFFLLGLLVNFSSSSEGLNRKPANGTISTKILGQIVTIVDSANNSFTDPENIQLVSNVNVTKINVEECPALNSTKNLSQLELIEVLTAPCRYDRLEIPQQPLEIFARTYINILENLDPSTLQFKIQGIFQVRYVDPRLSYDQTVLRSPQQIFGGGELKNLIWLPHIFLTNEHDSSILGTSEQDILTSIAPNGTVIISTRIQAALYCWLDLRKFPFDAQQCSTIFESWMYNASELMLHWELQAPLTFNSKMLLTEYTMQRAWTNESLVNANGTDISHGAFYGNYSSLSFTVYLTRDSGYYVMEYFLPSMMIVAISWVSFWLQADQTPARTILGTSTLLTFITLASKQENNLPKVNYIKISEIWFFGCTAFIFLSLMEFAFVNTIWRRKRSLESKKINGRYILKSTLIPTPKCRKEKECCNDSNLTEGKWVSTSTMDSCCSDMGSRTTLVTFNDEVEKIPSDDSWESMTPQEVSLWIDRKARFIFPLGFLLFNALFWTLVYCL